MDEWLTTRTKDATWWLYLKHYFMKNMFEESTQDNFENISLIAIPYNEYALHTIITAPSCVVLALLKARLVIPKIAPAFVHYKQGF